MNYKHSEKDFGKAIGIDPLFQEKVEVWMKEEFVDTHMRYDTMTETLEQFTSAVKPSSSAEWLFVGMTFKTAQMSLLMAKEQQMKEAIDDPKLKKEIDNALSPENIAEYVDSEHEII